jgi:hypothetical protein
MPETLEQDRIWEIIAKVGACMLTTRFDGGLRARPLEARSDRIIDLLLKDGQEFDRLKARQPGNGLRLVRVLHVRSGWRTGG